MIQIRHVRSDGFLFPLVCAFWASQVFLVPLAPIGAWPIWPALSDLILLLMIPAVLMSPRRGSVHIHWLKELSFWIAVVCLGSFILATTVYGTNRGTLIGGQQLYRLAQILFALLATSKVRLTPKRIASMGKLSLAVLLVNCALVIATALGLPTGISTPLLPDGPIAGPWYPFIISGLGEGTGFISYNHAYTAVQLILCMGLALSINRIPDRWRLALHMLFLVAMVLTRSRIGFLVALAFVLIYEIKRSKRVTAGIASLVIAGSLIATGASGLSEYKERQASVSSSFSDDGFSGRTAIWKEHVAYLANHPVVAVAGIGFGYSYEVINENAHMLYLHIATELGLIGLGVFLWASWRLLKALKAAGSRAMYWCFIALLFTGLSQETFYPTLAFTHFLAFFMSAVVAVIRIRSARVLTLRIT